MLKHCHIIITELPQATGYDTFKATKKLN